MLRKLILGHQILTLERIMNEKIGIIKEGIGFVSLRPLYLIRSPFVIRLVKTVARKVNYGGSLPHEVYRLERLYQTFRGRGLEEWEMNGELRALIEYSRDKIK